MKPPSAILIVVDGIFLCTVLSIYVFGLNFRACASVTLR